MIDFLKSDIGPLPAWGWLAAGVVGVGAGVALRRRGGGSGPVGTSSGSSAPVFLPQGYTPSVEADNGPVDNVQWRSSALKTLTAQGVSPTDADTALSAYLNGDDLANDQRGLIDIALERHNLPPSPPTIRPAERLDADYGVVPPVESERRPPVVVEPAPAPDRLTLIVEKAYRDILGRKPDPSGAEYWRGQLASGLSEQRFRAEISNSAEARRLRL